MRIEMIESPSNPRLICGGYFQGLGEAVEESLKALVITHWIIRVRRHVFHVLILCIIVELRRLLFTGLGLGKAHLLPSGPFLITESLE